MRYARWRFSLAMIVPALFAVLFLLEGAEWIDLRRTVLASQFTTGITGVGAKTLLAVLILAATAALGRWYCSLLCPAGILQDAFSRLGRTLGISRLGFAKPPFAANCVCMALAAAFT